MIANPHQDCNGGFSPCDVVLVERDDQQIERFMRSIGFRGIDMMQSHRNKVVLQEFSYDGKPYVLVWFGNEGDTGWCLCSGTGCSARQLLQFVKIAVGPCCCE